MINQSILSFVKSLPLVDDSPTAETSARMLVHDHLPEVLVLFGGHPVDDATPRIGDAALAVYKCTHFDKVQGGPSGRGLSCVDIKIRVLSQDMLLIMKDIFKLELNTS